MDFIAICIGLVLLIKGGELLFDGSIAFSLKMDIPKFIVGMTVVSIATSAPEFIVSIQAALMNYPDLALGNVIGSNLANIALVLGIIIIITPIKVDKLFYKIDWPVMMVVTLIFVFLVSKDNSLGKMDGIILLILLIIYFIFLFFFQRNRIDDSEVNSFTSDFSFYKIFSLMLFGAFFLWLGSEVLIKGSVNLASQIGISERIISVSIIAFGTSIPELSTSIIAIINKEKGISIGNLIGSNIIDMLGVIGITVIIAPITNLDQGFVNNDLIWMISVAFLLLPLLFLNKKLEFGRIEGIILIIIYLVFIGKLF
ncbi:calcium/sodium antiporter [Flavobacteriaceae bacterium]|jgi:cation:H+ antiporter|nr:calcium/sodium antiporter [Flavobacteriaceae bacterium]